MGVLAQQLFPDGEEIVFDHTKFDNNATRTADLIKNGITTIYEATFIYDDVLVMVDIIHRGDEGWDLYEVKFSTSVKDVYHNDIALQYYVLNGAGLTISKAAIIHINNQYTRHGELDLQQLFTIAELLDTIIIKQEDVKQELAGIKATVVKGSTMPTREIGPHCGDPYECDFSDHCWQHIPPKSVFTLTRMRSTGAYLLRSFAYKIVMIKACRLISSLVNIFPLYRDSQILHSLSCQLNSNFLLNSVR